MTALDDDAARLRLVVSRLSRRIRIDDGNSLPPLQLSALHTIGIHQPVRLADLARVEGVSPSTMSRVIAALVDRGLVERSADRQDARSLSIVITEAGRVELDAIGESRTALVMRRLRRLRECDRAAILEALPVIEALIEGDSIDR